MIKLSSGPALSAWGGVLKRCLLLLTGGPWLGPALWLLLPGFTAYTALPYCPLTRRVADQIANSQRSGFDVVGVVGMATMSACAVTIPIGLTPASGADGCDFRCRPLNPCGSP